MTGDAAAVQPRYRLNVLLFLLTLASTTLAYGLGHGFAWAAGVLQRVLADLPDTVTPASVIWAALWDGTLPIGRFVEEIAVPGGVYSTTVMTILLAHEMGHYVVGRWHGVNQSAPYFIPAPPFFMLGTFGAFISLREPIRDRNVLLDIGAAGPLAGMVVAVPLLAVGLSLSEVGPLTPAGMYEGNSLIYLALKAWVVGPIPAGQDVFLHPMAFAGWVGLLVTMLNLLPMSQLDGGHVIYALFGSRSVSVNRAFYGALIGLVLGLALTVDEPVWVMWAIWVVLIRLIGLKHPPTLDPDTPLTPGRRAIAWTCVVVFVLTFMPLPMSTLPPG